MKKPFRFNELSTVKCDCGKAIKKNLVARKISNNISCFSCFRQNKKKDISTAREVRTGKKIGREKGIYTFK